MGRVDRAWTKSGGRLCSHGRELCWRMSLRKSHTPGMMPFRVNISTAPDPQGSSRVNMPTHPYTTAACAAGAVTGTAGKDSWRYRYRGNQRTRQQTSRIANTNELNGHTTSMTIRGSVVSLSFIFPNPIRWEMKKEKRINNHLFGV